MNLLIICLFFCQIITTNGFNNWTYDNMPLALKIDVYDYQRFMPIENKNITFNHNFCESRLQDFKGPETWNAYTSLIISIVPFIYGFPTYPLLYNVACMLAVNGIASFHYHYFLNWFGKQGDEISMILANYFGLWGLINMSYKKSIKRNNINRFNTAFMYIFLVSNTIINNDYLFPSIFGVYIGGTLVMIYKVAKQYKIKYERNLGISFIGATGWIISEHYCNKYTKYGHPLWHLLFPLGFYKVILEFDKMKQSLNLHKKEDPIENV